MGCINEQKELKCSAMYQNTFQRSFIGTGGRLYQAKCDIKQINHKKNNYVQWNLCTIVHQYNSSIMSFCVC